MAGGDGEGVVAVESASNRCITSSFKAASAAAAASFEDIPWPLKESKRTLNRSFAASREALAALLFDGEPFIFAPLREVAL